VDGYDDRTYGEAFADVYDEWYDDVSDVGATVTDLLAFVGDGGRILELGVGTGRLAVPLAQAGAPVGIAVTGIDSSPAMLAKLADRDVGGLVTAVCGHMVHEAPAGPFDLVFVAYNTLFNLTAEGAHAACFQEMAARLRPGGRFVVEAFIPDEPGRAGNEVTLRSLTADRVVLAVTKYSPEQQGAEGQFIEFTESGGVRLRPWAVRYATPEQLDAFAVDAGFQLEHRWESFGDAASADARANDANRHVSVYRLAQT
jgi:SAM-dependent methyltransferase